MYLQDVLKKENNNLDIFRVVAAFMVIYGHAYALLPRAGERDYLGKVLVFDYSGSLAVKMFFFLSGLVVTNSLLDKQKIVPFAISRVFRIWPALIALLLATAFVLGPLMSKTAFGDYMASKAVYDYAYKGIFMNLQYELPGVFKTNAFTSVNGSLWSIPFEVFAYFVLAAVFLLGALTSRTVATALCLLILIDPLTGNKLIFTWLPQNPEVTLLGPCFAFGSLLALWKDKIRIDTPMLAGVWLLLFLFHKSAYNFYFLYLTLFGSMLYLASRPWLIRLKPPADISYGVYLWGWPLQQVMATMYPESSIRFNQLSTLVLATLFGLASWFVIEKRFIRMGAALARRVRGPQAGR